MEYGLQSKQGSAKGWRVIIRPTVVFTELKQIARFVPGSGLLKLFFLSTVNKERALAMVTEMACELCLL